MSAGVQGDRRGPGRACLLCLAILAAPSAILAAPSAILAQTTPERMRVLGNEPSSFLVDIKAAAVNGTSLAILTDPGPAVHVYRSAERRVWGSAGGGPGELASPVDIEWTEGSIFVLDMGRPKFVRYDESGSFVASRLIENTRARRLWIRGGDTILAAFTPMADARAAVRLHRDQVDTLFTYGQGGTSIRLEAPGAPSFVVKPPYHPQLEWTVLSDGAMARYDPDSGRLEWLDRDGNVTSTIVLGWTGASLTEEDREWWIESTIPADFMGRRVFDPLRSVARETLTFPNRLPRVLAAEADPGGGVWLRRTTPAVGEVWVLVSRDGGQRGGLRLPPGRRLLVVGEAELFARATDELGVETIEGYARPDWATAP